MFILFSLHSQCSDVLKGKRTPLFISDSERLKVSISPCQRLIAPQFMAWHLEYIEKILLLYPLAVEVHYQYKESSLRTLNIQNL